MGKMSLTSRALLPQGNQTGMHTELETKEGFFFLGQIANYESMENASVRPEYMFKNDIQRKRHPPFEK